MTDITQFKQPYSSRGNYVLITPARNEQDFIEATIKSVIGQSVLPREWIIVSDSSTDRTDEIVQDYSDRYPFLRLLRNENGRIRNFSAKVAAFRAGARALRTQDYEFIGNLDADVSFQVDYFEHLLRAFFRQAKLGVAGGLILEKIDSQFCAQDVNANSVAGAVQMFRRTCFEQIGGYPSIVSGGVDAGAEIMARMHGWQVETFPELQVFHHRRVATGAKNIFRTRFRQGKNHYLLGYHPLFQMLNSMYHLTEKPYLLGALVGFGGYVWGGVRRPEKALPPHVIDFLRCEQLQRIKSLRKEFRNRAKFVDATKASCTDDLTSPTTATPRRNYPGVISGQSEQ
jgi:glycosyltransferase involved in cell wall biosynthesis